MEHRFWHSVSCSFRSTIQRICNDPILRREIHGLLICAIIVNHRIIIDQFTKLCSYLLNPHCGSGEEPMLIVRLWLSYGYKKLYKYKDLLYSSPGLSPNKYAMTLDGLNKIGNFLKDTMNATCPPWDIGLDNKVHTCLTYGMDFRPKEKSKVVNHCKFFSKHSLQISEMKSFVIYQAMCRENEILPLLIMERINYLNNSNAVNKLPLTACVAFSKCIPEKCKSCLKNNNMVKTGKFLKESCLTKDLSSDCVSRLSTETFELNCKSSSTPIKVPPTNAEHSNQVKLPCDKEDTSVSFENSEFELGTDIEDTTFASTSLHSASLKSPIRKFIYDTLSSSDETVSDEEMECGSSNGSVSSEASSSSDELVDFRIAETSSDSFSSNERRLLGASKLLYGSPTSEASEFCDNSNSELKVNRVQDTPSGSTVLSNVFPGNRTHRLHYNSWSSSNSNYLAEIEELSSDSVLSNEEGFIDTSRFLYGIGSSETSKFRNKNSNSKLKMNRLQFLNSIHLASGSSRRFHSDSLSSSNSIYLAEIGIAELGSDNVSTHERDIFTVNKFFSNASSESSNSSNNEYDEAALSDWVVVESDNSRPSASHIKNIFDCDSNEVSNSYSECLTDKLHRYFDGLNVGRMNFLSNWDGSLSMDNGEEDRTSIPINELGKFKDDVADEPKKTSKVTFAPDDKLVTIHIIERDPEESLPNTYVLDRARFQMRIDSFNLLMKPFFTAEHGAKIMQRTIENQI